MVTEQIRPTKEVAMNTRRFLTLLGVFAAFVALLAPAAVAQEVPDGDELPPRLAEGIEKRCESVPDRIAEVEERIARLQGDADTPGSIAWVEKWADILRDFGLDAFADLLDERADLKQEGLELAEDWLANLTGFQKVCDDFGGDAG